MSTGVTSNEPVRLGVDQSGVGGQMVSNKAVGVLVLVVSLIAGALAFAPTSASAGPLDQAGWGLHQLPVRKQGLDQAVTDGGTVSISRKGTAIGWVRQTDPYDRPDRYFVMDQAASAGGLEEMLAPGRPTRMDGYSQLSADGKHFVATFKWGSDDSTCNPGGFTNYRHQQILMWSRDGAFGPFGDPELVSADSTNTYCDGDPYPPSDPGPTPTIGVGGDDDSSWPSVDETGIDISFVSRARNLGVAPDTPGVAAVYLREEGDLKMVTPADLNAGVSEAAMSADGRSIIFATTATNVVSGVSAGTSQVYLARAKPTEPGWDYTLISKNDAGDPSDAPAIDDHYRAGSSGLTISEDGGRIAYTSTATNLEAGVTNSNSRVVAVRDVTNDTTRVVRSTETTPSSHDFGDIPGRPALSLTGDRLAVMAATRSSEEDVFGTKALHYIDVDKVLASTPSDPLLSIRRYHRSANGGGFVAIGGEPDPEDPTNDTGNLVVFLSEKSPLGRYDGDPPSVYLAGAGNVGPDISRWWHGDPVDASTGNFRQEETDLAAPEGQPGADLTRTFDSFGDSTGMLGEGWMSPLDARLEPSPHDHQVLLTEQSGFQILFQAASGGGWGDTQNSRLTLAGPTSDQWTVTDSTGTVRTFDATGHLVGVERSDGTSFTVTWNDNVPDTLTTQSGYTLTFTDDTSYAGGDPEPEPDGRVDKVTSSDGREVVYTYQRVDGTQVSLRSATEVHLVGQDPATYGVTTYDLAGSLITKVTKSVDSSRSRVVVENSYDNWGRIVTQVNNTGDTLHFTYNQKPLGPSGMEDARGYTTVTNDASGDVTVYQYDASGAMIGAVDAKGKTVSSEWNGDQPDHTTDRTGLATSYTYDAAGRTLTVSETEPVGHTTRVVSTLTYVTAATAPTASTDDRIATKTDAAGVTTTYTYDGTSRQPATISVPCDAGSVSTDLTCPSSGKATTIYTYFTGDQIGLVQDQTDADGVKTSYTYDSDRDVASITTYPSSGHTLVTAIATYHPGDSGWVETNPAAARATKITAPSGAIWWKAYDAQGQLIETRDPLYNGTSHLAAKNVYRYDGTLVSATDPAGHTVTSDVRRDGDPGWSEASNIAEVRTVTDADGVSTVSKVDRSGDIVVEQRGNLAVPASLATTTHTYGALGRRLTTTGPDGVKTTYHYDDDGRITGTTRGPDGDAAGFTSTTEYNARGETTATQQPLGTNPDSTAVTKRTQFYYDAAGRKVAQLEGVGGPTDQQLLTGYSYDNAGRLYRTIEHRHSELDPAHAQTIHSQDLVTETRFTVGGRTAQQLAPPVDVATFDWSGAPSTKQITRLGYDEAGRQISTTTPDGRVTATTFDDDGRPSTVTSPEGRETSYGYDAAGHPTSVTTPSGFTGSGDPTTVTATSSYYADGRVHTTTDPHVPVTGVTDPSTRTMTYTSGGRLLVATDALNRTTTYAYDARGNRTSRTVKDDANANVVESWTFDAADRVTSHTVPAPRSGATVKTTTAVYDPDYGWKSSNTDPLGRNEVFAYYNDGTLKSQHWTLGTQPTVDVKFWINQRGFTTKTRDEQGTSARDTAYTTDRVGQRVAETTPIGAVITRGFDLTGNQTTLGYPDGAAASYTHNVDGQLIDVTVTSGGISVPFATYTYDDDGNQLTETMHAAGEATRTNALNAAGQVTTFTEAMRKPDNSWDNYQAVMTWRADGRLGTEKINSDPTTTYTYDHAGQITAASSSADSRAWTYGTRGNRLTSVHNGTTTTYLTNPNASVAKATTGSEVVNYFYNDDSQRTVANTKVSGSTTREVTSGYNARGLTTTVQTLTPPTSSAVTEYRSYDADGLIAQADIGGDGATKTWKYQWDTTRSVPQVIDTKAQGAIWTRATWANSRIGYKVGTADPVWFQYDAHGSTIRQDDANTALADGPPAYTAFGQPTDTVPYVRTGYRAEFTSGDLTYLRSRDYDAASGQFTTPDSLDAVDGTTTTGNSYHYVDNDPLNKIDPQGTRACDREFNTKWTGAVDKVFGRVSCGDMLSDTLAACQNVGGNLYLFSPVNGRIGCVHFNPCDGGDTVVWNTLSSWSCNNSDDIARIATVILHGLPALIPGYDCYRTIRGEGGASSMVFCGLDLIPVLGEVADTVKVAARTEAATEEAVDAAHALEEGAHADNVAQEISTDDVAHDLEGACRNSFTPETKVVMADGTRKRLSMVRVGDHVRTADPHLGFESIRTVTDTLSHDDDDLLDVSIQNDSGTLGVLHTTAHHPIWVRAKRAWVRASELVAGDQLQEGEQRGATVVRTRRVPGHHRMLDLTVATDHTFYVAVAGESILVHNADCRPWEITEAGTARTLESDRFGKFYQSKSDGLWWSKDTAGHGGVSWKVFREEGDGLHWYRDADVQGNFVSGKHKGPIGDFISWKSLHG